MTVMESADDTAPPDGTEPPGGGGEPEDRPGAGHKTRWRRLRRPTPRAAVIALLLAALGTAGYEGRLLFAQHQRQVAAHQALDAAQQFAVKFTNADPATIDQVIDEITGASTGEFKAKYVKNISQLRSMLIENKVTTRGTVVRSAIESVSPNRVEVLMFVRESFSSAALPKPAPDPSAEPSTDVVGMAITMEKVDGRWLAGKVVPGDKL